MIRYETETDVVRTMGRVLPLRVYVSLWEISESSFNEAGTTTQETKRRLVKGWSLPVDEEAGQ